MRALDLCEVAAVSLLTVHSYAGLGEILNCDLGFIVHQFVTNDLRVGI